LNTQLHQALSQLLGDRFTTSDHEVLLLVYPNVPGDLEEAERINECLVLRALSMGGTITGEHGVGLGKVKFMHAEHGSEALAVMRAIKLALDPDNLMNPGKMIPEE